MFGGKSGRVALRFLLLTSSAWLYGCAVAAADEPVKAADITTHTPTTQDYSRTLQQIIEDFQQTAKPLNQMLSSGVILDEAKRKEAAPKAIARLKSMQALATELRNNPVPQGKVLADQLEPKIYSMLVIFDDAQTKADLQKQAKDPNPARAAIARASFIMAHWALAENDPKSQEKLAGEAQQLAKEYPDNELARMLDEVYGAEVKIGRLKDQPLTVEGVRNDGHPFTTANWKGKVILVDFWATWCPPCLAELPHLMKVYKDYHERGFEIIGISSDEDGKTLSDFLAKHPDMPWPQLFDPKATGWHPLTKQFGVTSLPSMFLIDKNGNCRSVTAVENYEELIPKLLEEK